LIGTLRLVTSLILSQLPPSPQTADAILARIDARLQASKSQVVLMDMAIEDPGHAPRHIGMRMHMQGERRHIQFLYPGDMKGIAVLNLSAEQTYVYMPAFGKVRRIASHLRDQTLFGSDYNFDDFGTISLHQNFAGQITAEDPSQWHLSAEPKQSSRGAHGRIELVVNKSNSTVDTLKFFDPAGKHIRTETRDAYTCNDDGCAPTHTKMVDHRHNDHWTEVTIKDLQLGAQIRPKIFSLRALQRQE
jgi:hypothetical protein